MGRAINLILLVFCAGAWAQQTHLTSEKLYSRALEAAGQRKFNDALGLLDKAIAEKPDYAEAYALRGITRERLKDYNGALTDYTASLQFLPDQFEVLWSRAALRYQEGHYALALEDFNRLLTLPAGETNTVYYRQSAHREGTDQMLTAQGAIHSQIFNYLGLIELELEHWHNAILHFDSAITLDPDEADYYVNRAMARQDCNRKDADDDFKKALELYPDHPIAKHNLAVSAAREGSYEVAEQQLSEAIESDSLLLDPYLERGYYRMLRKDYHGALHDYSRALELEQNDAEIWLNRGMAREKLKDWKGAFSDYTRAIDLKPDFTKAWLNRGNVLAAQGRYSDAIEDYSAAISYMPSYAAAFYNRAISHYKSGNKTNACSDAREATRLGYRVDEKMLKQFCAQAH